MSQSPSTVSDNSLKNVSPKQAFYKNYLLHRDDPFIRFLTKSVGQLRRGSTA